jgi:hypothetical protein
MQEFIGKKFGKWTVTNYIGKILRVHKFNVICECGNESISDKIALTRNKSTQCRSCARKSSTNGERNSSYKHGYASVNHPQFHLHFTWCSIKQRCYNPKVKNYHRYGGRGITMCDKWLNDFEQFVKDMGERPKGHSIDRINNDLGYCPENCKWVTKETNCNNTSTNFFYEFDNQKLSEAQWARKFGLTRNKFMYWVKKNGIDWVSKNIDIINKTKKGMNDKEYKELGLELPNKRDRH